MNLENTCWTLIEAAADGKHAEREEFARRYEPVVRAYLGARWRGRANTDDVEDACQEVFAEFFRRGGPLERAPQRKHDHSFRAYLYGVVRNVALRVEHRNMLARQRAPANEAPLSDIRADETSMSRAFDRAWAVSLLRQAADVQADLAKQQGESAQRRVELLRMRFQEGLPIREIAKRWTVDAAKLHREYAKARTEFTAALREVVASHENASSAAEIDNACRELMTLVGS